MHISILLCLCRANRCVCDDGAHCWIGVHVSCSICYLDSLRASYCFLRLGKLFFYYSSGRFRYSPPCPALPAAILASFHSPCYSCSHPIRLRRCGAWVAHLWFRRACVCFCYCGAFFEVKRYGSTFGGGFAGILVVSVIDYGVCVSQSESFVIDRHHRNFSWSSSYSSFCIGEYGYEISANEVRAVGPCQSG